METPPTRDASPSAQRLSEPQTKQETAESMYFRSNKRRIEEKFAQVQRDRNDARAVRREMQRKERNEKADEQIMLLMQCDERLASLLSQAAESMIALLPPSVTSDLNSDLINKAEPSYGAKAFEARAQRWFAILNDVQLVLRSAVRHLRDSHLTPLSVPVGPQSRNSGLAGSANKGHTLSLLNAFVDGPEFKCGDLAGSAPVESASGTNLESRSSGSSGPSSSFDKLDSSLSLSALRAKNRNWKELANSLESLSASMATEQRPDAAPSYGGSTLDVKSMLEGAGNSDKLLIEALVNGRVNLMAWST
ncbi:hypothetical protein IE53DRAFT_236112 [Violaceomyces palustris]|uniref:Uncharacterized protein n=1 Tax=Violaceomyces palustris TaxID=1673888 RepID=A0ACD0NP99_9BASI|nr:hypothetical protein IE53DRAFT_236112 [Violaceomyces palustris]